MVVYSLPIRSLADHPTSNPRRIHDDESTTEPTAFFDFGHLQGDHRGTRGAAGDLPITLNLAARAGMADAK